MATVELPQLNNVETICLEGIQTWVEWDVSNLTTHVPINHSWFYFHVGTSINHTKNLVAGMAFSHDAIALVYNWASLARWEGFCIDLLPFPPPLFFLTHFSAAMLSKQEDWRQQFSLLGSSLHLKSINHTYRKGSGVKWSRMTKLTIINLNLACLEGH